MSDAPASDAAQAGAGGSTARTVAVAFSGGRDSLALLHATCRAAQPLGVAVVALHVHHNLLPEADAWLQSARRLCARWARRGWPVTLLSARLEGAPARGDSVEAWARAGRHAALARLAGEAGASLLLLAQHRRDQAETVLLQALRGAGAAGLSAMPELARRGGLVWARPWLAQPREAIEAYVARHRLRPLEDPSNTDPAFARNRLRLLVWPALTTAFADAEPALAAAAHRAQQERAALAEWVQQDLAPLREGSALRLGEAWDGLSSARRALVLRAWLHEQQGPPPSEALVQRLVDELPGRATGRWPAGQGWCCALYRGRLRCGPDPSPTTADMGPPRATARGRSTAWLNLSAPGWYPLPDWGGAFEVTQADQRGAEPAMLGALVLRPRRGGERFALAPRGLPRALKKQYQACAIPEPARVGPLLWVGERLLFAPGLGIDARLWPAQGSPQLALVWHAGAAWQVVRGMHAEASAGDRD